MSIELITDNEIILAIIIPRQHTADGLQFITPDDFSQQVAYMHHPAGKIIQPHVHRVLQRQVNFTQEVLFIKRGKIRVDFYRPDHTYLFSKIFLEGDTVLLAFAGHGIEILEEAEMIEVKQGPYGGDYEKVRFEVVSPENIILR
jgi:hypothetical protein